MMKEICSLENLRQAFKRVERNKGSPGIDGETIAEFRFFLEDNLAELELDLGSGSYRPQPVRRVEVDKLGSADKRPLGIPTVRDRVVQAASGLSCC